MLVPNDLAEIRLASRENGDGNTRRNLRRITRGIVYHNDKKSQEKFGERVSFRLAVKQDLARNDSKETPRPYYPPSEDCTIRLTGRSGTVPWHCNLRRLGSMKRVVILGRGASGKSTLARRLGDIMGLPVIELDKFFWQPGLIARPREQWVVMQEKLVARDRWIMDGDLGPYDTIEVRLRAADTILFLDFSLVRCTWRAIRRSRERADFWRWLLAYRYQSRPILRAAIAKHAPNAVLHVFRSPKALSRFVAEAASVTPVVR